jgi:hypothetical protein
MNLRLCTVAQIVAPDDFAMSPSFRVLLPGVARALPLPETPTRSP